MIATPQQLAVGQETLNSDEPGDAGRVLPGSLGNGLLPSAHVLRLIHRRRLMLRQLKGGIVGGGVTSYCTGCG